jgi:hypothetical protein
VRKFFLVGPILLLIPLMLWAWAWALALTDENQSWYIVWPMFGLVGLAATWHLALIIVEKPKRYAYVAYAAIFLPLFYIAMAIAVIPATHFPL